MKISTNSARSTSSLAPPAHAVGGTIIHSRPPIFALTTSLSCFLIAWLFSFRRFQPSKAINIDSRRQRDELLLFVRARQLEEMMLRVGLGPSIGTPGHRDIDSPHDHGNGAATE